MRSTRQRLASITILAGLTTMGLGLVAGPASAGINDCVPHLDKDPNGHLVITSTPAANSTVPAGSDISILATWDTDDWAEQDNLYVCPTVNGNWAPDLAISQWAQDKDGTDTWNMTVPSDMPAGTNLCVRELLTGASSDETVDGQVSQRSNQLCYTTAAAPTTTTTAAPTTTTTMAPEQARTAPVDPEVTEARVAPAPAEPVVAGEVAQNPEPLPTLPRTGHGIDVLAMIGAAILALGGFALALGRRRSLAS